VNALAGALLRGVDPAALGFDLGLDLDEWQRTVLRSRDDCLVAGGRQIGKSTIAALSALHTALFEPGSLTLLVAPAHRQSLETFRTCIGLYKQLGRPVDAEVENTLALTLASGSRILALPGSESTLRGYGAVSMIVLDEAARIPDALLHAVLPMLAISRGRIIAISTPNGPAGWFYEAWSDEGSRWRRLAVRSDECPRISREFLAEQRRLVPASSFAREYEVSFLDPEGAAFRREDIDAAFTEGIEQWEV
jgi:hypothetical protein